MCVLQVVRDLLAAEKLAVTVRAFLALEVPAVVVGERGGVGESLAADGARVRQGGRVAASGSEGGAFVQLLRGGGESGRGGAGGCRSLGECLRMLDVRRRWRLSGVDAIDGLSAVILISRRS